MYVSPPQQLKALAAQYRQQKCLLSRLPMDPQHVDAIEVYVIRCFIRPTLVHKYDAPAWGAGMLLVAARMFSRIPLGPFTYRNLFAELGLPLDSSFTAFQYNALERGAELWDIPIPQRGGKRQFQATMLLHSGGGWPVLLALTAQVESYWNWNILPELEPERLCVWITQLWQSQRLDAKFQTILADEETRYAMAIQLQTLAELKHELERQEESEQLEVIQARAGAPDESSARALLALWWPQDQPRSQSTRGSAEPTWCLEDTSDGQAVLNVTLPKQLSGEILPASVQKVVLSVPGAPGSTRYERKNLFDHQASPFVRTQGPKSLLVNRLTGDTFPVWMRWQEGMRFLEQPYTKLTLPDPVLERMSQNSGPLRWTLPTGARPGFPPCIQLVWTRDESPADTLDLPTLYEQGALLLRGAPRSRAQLSIADATHTLQLDAQGYRLFPLAQLPPSTLEGTESLELIAMLEGLTTPFRVCLSSLRDRPPERSRTLTPGGLQLTLKPHADCRDDVHLELLQADAPWETSTRIPLTRRPPPAAATTDDFDPQRSLLTLRPQDTPVFEGLVPMFPESRPDRAQWGFLMQGETRVSGRFPIRFEKGGTAEGDTSTIVQAALEQQGDRILQPLLSQVARYGLSMMPFNVAACPALGERRLRAFLRRQRTELDQLLLQRMGHVQVSLLWIRYAELTRACETLLHEDVLDPEKAIDRLVRIRAGLLVPFLQSAFHAFPLDAMENAASQGGPFQSYSLSEDALEHIRTPDHPELPALPTPTARALGLLEARRLGDEHLGTLLTSVGKRPPALEQTVLELRRAGKIPGGEPRLPERLQQLEACVAALTLALHHWRRGTTLDAPPQRQALERLHEQVPRLIDFWASYWFQQPFQPTSEALSPRTKPLPEELPRAGAHRDGMATHTSPKVSRAHAGVLQRPYPRGVHA